MADRIQNYSTLSFSVTLERNNETVYRSFQFEADSSIIDNQFKPNINEFRELLLNKFNRFFQPTNWRDSNLAEEEWLTTGVSVKYINRRETTFDFS